ncbi:unnamed protein product [Adineta steineri]|uniref:Uncharacterized protein n=1 Tax=Adineta steineri TaxID=433720 RepID=A0A814IRZ7_9BILA|nr:unnamed protein product [Adineta steineri]CAF3804411.1 unnamed protein product [Adineta steineri]
MPLSCDYNGTKCKTLSTGKTIETNTISGFIIASIACLIFIIFLVIITYMLCCKGYFRNRFHTRSRLHPTLLNQNQSMSINLDEQQSIPNSQKSPDLSLCSDVETKRY